MIITSITLYVYVGMLTIVQFRMGVGARQLQVSDDKCLQYKIGLLLTKPLLKESLIVKLEKKKKIILPSMHTAAGLGEPEQAN